MSLTLPELLPVVLVHGGLYEEMTPGEFWVETGVTAALGRANVAHLAPSRPLHPQSWDEERATLASAIDDSGWARVVLVGASNGCSTAARFAIEHPERVARLMLAWPATANDQVMDGLAEIIIGDVASTQVARALLGGETLRGVRDDEIASLDMPLVIWPSLPENQAHQRQTVMGLLAANPDAMLIGGSPEPLDRQFGEHVQAFVDLVVEFARVEPDD